MSGDSFLVPVIRAVKLAMAMAMATQRSADLDARERTSFAAAELTNT